jgi:hypothetical protein
LLLISLSFVLSEFIGANGKQVTWILVILLLLNQFEIVMWYFADWARLYIAIESCILMGAALFLIKQYRRKVLQKESPLMRFSVRFAFVVFVLAVIAFITNIFGYLDLSVLMLKVAIDAAISVLLIYGISKIFKVIVVALFTVLRTIRDENLLKYLDKIELRTINIINILAVIYFFSTVLTFLEVRRPVIDYISRNLEEKWVVGTMTVSIGGILLLIIILLVTLIISKFFKILIEEEIAPRCSFCHICYYSLFYHSTGICYGFVGSRHRSG